MRDRTLWTWHIGAGVVILVLLGLHMAIMHLDATLGIFSAAGGEPVEWESVAARAPSVFFTVTYVLLLGAALYHGLYGLRNILLELNPGAGLRRTINVGLLLVGVGAVRLRDLGGPRRARRGDDGGRLTWPTRAPSPGRSPSTSAATSPAWTASRAGRITGSRRRPA